MAGEGGAKVWFYRNFWVNPTGNG